MNPPAATEGTAERDPAGWRARLSLRFERRGGQTVLTNREHVGPLLVQRPFYPQRDGTCHVYVLHPPGGLVGGDRLHVSAAVGPGARALLTTPAAGKFYRSLGAQAEQVQEFHVAANGCLEWLPQETIVFSGARASQRTEVHLANDGAFLGWDIVCLGRPASDDAFRQGEYRGALEIWRKGRRLLVERGLYPGGGEILEAPWGLAGSPVMGTFAATCAVPGLVEAAREAAGGTGPDERIGFTQVEGVLVGRYLGRHGQAARQRFTNVWQVVREALLGESAAVPRIWST
jgi:urease accessory protein